MSVEVKDTNKSKLKAEWENIGKLYCVYLRRKPVALYFIIIAIILTLFFLMNILLINVAHDDMVYIQSMDSGCTEIFAIFVLIICLMASNLLTDPEISIYPGTVKTRFLSRVLYDFSMIILGAVICMVFHLIDIGILKLLASTGKYVYSEILFDGRTFLLRSVLWIGYLMLGYSMLALIFVISTKLGNIVSVVICGVIIAGCALFWKLTGVNIFAEIYAFYFGDNGASLGFGKAICRIYMTILILFILTYMVMSMIHSWHEESHGEKMAVGLICVVVVLGSYLFIGLSYPDRTNYEAHTLEEDIAAGNVIVNDRIISPGKVDAEKLNHSYETSFADMDFSVGWCEYEQAKACGLISDLENFSQGEMLVRIVADNVTYKDISVFDNFISDVGVDIVDSRYVLTMPGRVLMYDDFLSSMDGALGNQAEALPYEAADQFTTTLSYCQVYIIYHDEDMMSSEEIMSYDVSTRYISYLP